MRYASSQSKATRQTKSASARDSSTGREAISMAPPEYGIDFVDQGSVDAIQRKERKDSLPANLRGGIESLSGISMADVRVHYNSSKPVQLQALAYTKGTDIYVRAGQERHLAHEAWHVVQQKLGRVRPTVRLPGLTVNDDPALEREADVMGSKARCRLPGRSKPPAESSTPINPVVQGKWDHLFNDIPKTLAKVPNRLKNKELEDVRTSLNTIRDKPKHGIAGLHAGADANALQFGEASQIFIHAVRSFDLDPGDDRVQNYLRLSNTKMWEASIDHDVRKSVNMKLDDPAVKNWDDLKKPAFLSLKRACYHSSMFRASPR